MFLQAKDSVPVEGAIRESQNPINLHGQLVSSSLLDLRRLISRFGLGCPRLSLLFDGE